MINPTSVIWKFNKLMAAIMVLTVLSLSLVIIFTLSYSRLQPVINKDAYNKKCSTSYHGCGRYGANAECNVIASYNTATKRNVYTERGTVDYGKLNGPGGTHWYCSTDDARSAGYVDAYN